METQGLQGYIRWWGLEVLPCWSFKGFRVSGLGSFRVSVNMGWKGYTGFRLYGYIGLRDPKPYDLN